MESTKKAIFRLPSSAQDCLSKPDIGAEWNKVGGCWQKLFNCYPIKRHSAQTISSAEERYKNTAQKLGIYTKKYKSNLSRNTKMEPPPQKNLIFFVFIIQTWLPSQHFTHNNCIVLYSILRSLFWVSILHQQKKIITKKMFFFRSHDKRPWNMILCILCGPSPNFLVGKVGRCCINDCFGWNLPFSPFSIFRAGNPRSEDEGNIRWSVVFFFS